MDDKEFESAVGASFLDDSRRDALRRDPGHKRRMRALTLLVSDEKAAYEKYPDLKDYFDKRIAFSKSIREELKD
jgi:hypothetical protein